MSMSAVPLVEETGEEPAPSQPKKFRRGVWMGMLAAAVMGTMVAVKVSMPQPLTPKQRLSVFRKHLVRAFSTRKLDDEPLVTVDMNFLINAVDAADPDAMGFTSKVKTSEGDHEKTVGKFTFKAVEGMGNDLATALKDLVKAVCKAVEDEDLLKRFTFDPTDNDVTVSVDMEDDKEAMDEEGMDEEGMDEEGEIVPPEMDFSFTFGRTSDEMCKMEDTPLIDLLNGVKLDFHTSIGPALLDAPCNAEEFGKKNCEEMDQKAAILQSLRKVKQNLEIRYLKGELFTGELFQGRPELQFLSAPINMMTSMGAMMIPPGLSDAVLNLDGKLDGVLSATIVGLPQNQEIATDFKNFHVLPFLKLLSASAS